jgi:hypothetical protein
MSKRTAVAFLMVFGVGVCAAYADSNDRMVALWTCTLAEGKTQVDVQAANGKWVKHVNSGDAEGDIRSYVLTTVVGEQGKFLYVDSFPSGKAWLAARAALESEEGKKIEKELDAVAKCSRNSLYESKQSGAPD